MRKSDAHEMPLSHSEIEDLLSIYLVDELSPVEKEGVDTHLMNCPACRQALADLRKITSLLASLQYEKQPVPSSSLADQVIARLNDTAAPEAETKLQIGSFSSTPTFIIDARQNRKIRFWSVLFAAVLIIAVLGASTLMFVLPSSQTGSQPTPVAMASIPAETTPDTTALASIKLQAQKEIETFKHLLDEYEPKTVVVAGSGMKYHEDFSYRGVGAIPLSPGETPGALKQLMDNFNNAQSQTQYQLVYDRAHELINLYHAFLENVDSSVLSFSQHKMDMVLIEQYMSGFLNSTKTSECVVVISLREQILRVYNAKGYQTAYLVTTGSVHTPLLPGVWKLQMKKRDIILMSPYQDQAQESVHYAFQLNSKQTIHDSDWRVLLGPGTQFPHYEKSENHDNTYVDGDRWGVGMTLASIEALDQMVSPGTTVIVY
jgi:hypothetical protein